MSLIPSEEIIERLIEQSRKLIEGTGSKQLHSSLLALRYDNASNFEASIYRPVACLILQGAKETILGKKRLQFGKGQMLIVSHDVPVSSRVISATPAEPYLALIFSIDLKLLRSLYDQIESAVNQPNHEMSLSVVDADPGFLDAMSRLISAIGSPEEERVLSPLILKELHFRILTSPGGSVLRRLLHLDSNSSKIWRAIQYIRDHFRDSLLVPELAKDFGMGVSSFHTHFKNITETSPLQYQKQLRLLEAKRLLHEGEQTVTDVAFEVGYESPNQFSREYTRKFGVSPRNEGRIALA